MRNPGLEPGSLAALEPESSASANSASSACIFCVILFTSFHYLSMISNCQLGKSKFCYRLPPIPTPHFQDNSGQSESIV